MADDGPPGNSTTPMLLNVTSLGVPQGRSCMCGILRIPRVVKSTIPTLVLLPKRPVATQPNTMRVYSQFRFYSTTKSKSFATRASSLGALVCPKTKLSSPSAQALTSTVLMIKLGYLWGL